LTSPILIKTVDVRGLGPGALRSVKAQLAAVFAEVVSLDDDQAMDDMLSSVTAKPGAMLDRVHLVENVEGRVVGFYSSHVSKGHVAGRDVALMSASAVVLPAYRRSPQLAVPVCRDMFDYKVANPDERLLLIGLMSASGYAVLTRYFPVYPAHDKPQSEHADRFLAELHALDQRPREEVHPEHSSLVRLPVTFGEDEIFSPNSPRVQESASLRFYFARNPDAQRGWVLPTLVPLTSACLLHQMRLVSAHVEGQLGAEAASLLAYEQQRLAELVDAQHFANEPDTFAELGIAGVFPQPGRQLPMI